MKPKDKKPRQKKAVTAKASALSVSEQLLEPAALLNDVRALIQVARQSVATTVNTAMVQLY